MRGGANCRRGFERPGAVERRQALEQSPLRLARLVIAPIDGGSQCLMTWQPAIARNEQAKAIVQVRGDLFDGEHPATGCREFDRQRDTVKPRAHIAHGAHGLSRQRELGMHHARAGDVQPDCLRFKDLRLICVCCRQRQARHRVGVLTMDPQGLSAGRDNANCSTRPKYRFGELCARDAQVFAIVDHEQHRARAQELAQPLHHGVGAIRSHPYRFGHGFRDQPPWRTQRRPRELVRHATSGARRVTPSTWPNATS